MHIQLDLAAMILKTLQKYFSIKCWTFPAYLHMQQKGSKTQPVKFLDKDSVSMEVWHNT